MDEKLVTGKEAEQETLAHKVEKNGEHKEFVMRALGVDQTKIRYYCNHCIWKSSLIGEPNAENTYHQST